jgi:DNA-binding NarL/FixJ family response regulator
VRPTGGERLDFSGEVAEVGGEFVRWSDMSTATVVQALSVPRAASPRAAVLGSDAGMLRPVASLLAEAGFSVSAEPRPDALLVLVARGNEAERRREIRALAEARPEARILAIMPTGVSNPVLRRALLAGAVGIVLDGELDRTLVPTAHAVVAGQLTVPSALAGQIAPKPLSHREKQVLALVVKGLTNREIADTLYLAESTVKTHLVSAFRKLDARSRSDAVARIQDPESGYGMSVLALVEG